MKNHWDNGSSFRRSLSGLPMYSRPIKFGTQIYLNVSHNLWILWGNKQTYSVHRITNNLLFGIRYRHDGNWRMFPVITLTRAPEHEEYPPALAMPFMKLLFLSPGVFWKIYLWEDSYPFEKLLRLHFRIHLERKKLVLQRQYPPMKFK